MHSVNVTVPSSTGTAMAGTIDFPDSTPAAFAIFAHCFAGSRHTPGAARVSKQLTQHNIATLRFDFPGLGQSEGNFARTTFTQNVADIQAAAHFLESNYQAPQLLVGHSLGGAASLAAASNIPSLKCVATLGAPFDPAHSVLHYADKIGEIDSHGEVEVHLGGRSLAISREFLEDLAETNPAEYLRKLRKPLLILHSPIDQTVGIDNAQNIFKSTRYPKSLVSLDKTDHLLTKQGTAARAADLIAAWAEQFIEPNHTPAVLAADTVHAHSIKGLKYGSSVAHNGCELSVDRLRSQGGKGQGTTTQGLILSALAASSIEAINEAARGLKLDSVEVEVQHIHGFTCERRIKFTGELSKDEKALLLQALRQAHSFDPLVWAAAETLTLIDVVSD